MAGQLRFIDGLGLWYLTPLSTIFQLYNIVAVSFIGGGNRRTAEYHRPVASH